MKDNLWMNFLPRPDSDPTVKNGSEPGLFLNPNPDPQPAQNYLSLTLILSAYFWLKVSFYLHFLYRTEKNNA